MIGGEHADEHLTPRRRLASTEPPTVIGGEAPRALRARRPHGSFNGAADGDRRRVDLRGDARGAVLVASTEPPTVIGGESVRRTR